MLKGVKNRQRWVPSHCKLEVLKGNPEGCQSSETLSESTGIFNGDPVVSLRSTPGYYLASLGLALVG